MKDKRGVIGIIVFFVLLFSIVMLGFIASIVVGVIDFGGDNLNPLLTDFGVVGNTNLTQAGENTFGVVNTFSQALPWLVGLSYMLMIIFSIVFAVSFKYNQSRAFIVVYLLLIILLIFGTIILSNMYENIYTQNNALSSRLQEQTIMSYMILHSPVIMTIIAFITGIYMFSRNENSFGGL